MSDFCILFFVKLINFNFVHEVIGVSIAGGPDKKREQERQAPKA